MWCVGVHSTTVWLGDDPYLFLPCCLIIVWLLYIFYVDEEISGLCFLSLSVEDWKNYKLSKAGVFAIARLQEMIKAAY